MNSENCAISDCFKDLAIAMEIQGEQWRSSSYLNASEEILNLNENLYKIYTSGRIREIKGVGPSIESKIVEYFETGKIGILEDARSILPDDMDVFRRLPLTLREIADVCIFADVHSAADLLLAVEEGLIHNIPGLGPVVESKLKSFIAWLGEQSAELPYCIVNASAESVHRYISNDHWTTKAELAGPFRRKDEIATAFTILVSSSADRAVPLFAMCPDIQELTHANKQTATGKTISGTAAMLKSMSPEQIPFEQLRLTGPIEHINDLENRAAALGLTLSPESMGEIHTERDIYARLGMEYVPPEFRSGGESNITLKGDLRVRSISADGSLNLDKIVSQADCLGYEYICIVDRLCDRITPGFIRERNGCIDKMNCSVDILKGIEVDISYDGALSAPGDIINSSDLVIASVNSHLDCSEDLMTRRIAKALKDPRVDVWGHPLNRLIGIRNTSIPDCLFELASQNGIALEINTSPYRSDLDCSTICKVYEPDALYSIGTDAVLPHQLKRIELGKIAAEKARLPNRRLLNTLTSTEIRDKAWRD